MCFFMMMMVMAFFVFYLLMPMMMRMQSIFESLVGWKCYFIQEENCAVSQHSTEEYQRECFLRIAWISFSHLSNICCVISNSLFNMNKLALLFVWRLPLEEREKHQLLKTDQQQKNLRIRLAWDSCGISPWNTSISKIISQLQFPYHFEGRIPIIMETANKKTMVKILAIITP